MVERYQAQRLKITLTDKDLIRALEKKFPDLDSSLNHMNVRRVPIFFLSSSDLFSDIEPLYHLYSKVKEKTILAADRIYDHKFNLLSSGETQLGDKVDWHIDFISGYRWNPKTYYADLQPASYTS